MESIFLMLSGIFVLSALLSGILIPRILRFSFRMGLFDVQDGRRLHEGLVPRLGGLAFAPVVLFCLLLFFGLNFVLGLPFPASPFQGDAVEMSFQCCALLLLYAVGVADDLVGVGYPAKFVAQLLGGVLLAAGGVRLDSLCGLLGLFDLPFWAGSVLTVLVVVFLTNAVNLIDGLDGLASGLVMCGCVVYSVCFFASGHFLYAALSLSVLGVLLPFFYYNVFGRSSSGRKIFMGDSGSLTLGFVMGVLGIRLSSALSGGGSEGCGSLALSFSPMLVPCLDVLRVFLDRLLIGRNPFLPDRTHIHHKLLSLGLSSGLSVLAVVAFSVLLTLCNVVLSGHLNVNVLLLGDLLLWIVLNMWMSGAIARRRRKVEAPGASGG